MKPDLTWLDPRGGLGDALMLSTALKRSLETFPERRYALVLRTKYLEVLEGHPALALVGHPPRGARILATDYWNHASFAEPGARAIQVLAGILGLPGPVDERPFLAPPLPDVDELLAPLAPGPRILLAPATDSPRKMLPHPLWEDITARLLAAGLVPFQVGRRSDRHVRGTFSMTGVTTPRQVISLAARADLVLGPDSFAMHAAALAGTPAVILWGPTHSEVYGPRRQRHLQVRPACATPQGCIRPGGPALYRSSCDAPEGHCMARHDPALIAAAVLEVLAAAQTTAPR